MSSKTCLFKECGRVVKNVYYQLCSGHYKQVRMGYDLTPINDARHNSQRIDGAFAECTRCKRWLPTKDSYGKGSGKYGLATWCKKCMVLYSHGITYHEYEKMLISQDGVCKICRGENEDDRGLAVDHDHSCCPRGKIGCGKCIRGLLCRNCNWILGLSKDKTSVLLSATRYLKEFE